MTAHILIGDAVARLSELRDRSAQTCITSPPYWGLRDYGHDGQIGLEPTPDEYVARIVEVLREVWRVLADDGTLWLNLGDSYASGKQLVGVPWRLAFALQADGWYLRQDIIWHKPNPMPESVKDRCTKAHEYLFLLTKWPRYYYNADSIRQPLTDATLQRDKTPRGRSQDGGGSAKSLSGYNYTNHLGDMSSNAKGANKRSVWSIGTKPYKGAHFAVMPEALVEPCVLAGSKPGDLVLDPFAGSGTVGVVALRHGRDFVGVELNEEYATLAEQRILDDAPLLNDVRVM